jgi:hypothetical protein
MKLFVRLIALLIAPACQPDTTTSSATPVNGGVPLRSAGRPVPPGLHHRYAKTANTPCSLGIAGNGRWA